MLSKLDETLRHQLPTTFDHVWTSDPRQFDRYWFCAYEPEGGVVLITGMGLYSNQNVLDGFVAIQRPRPGGGADQHNFRVSRELRPKIDETAVGPLSVEVLEPFERARLLWSPGEDDVSFDLEWRAFLPPKEEDPHFGRLRGRVSQDYRRYTQNGRASGTLTLGSETFEVRDWFAARDHSWGIRPGVGGPEPVTGSMERPRAATGFVFFWLPFSTPEFGGHVQYHMLGDGTPTYLDGVLQWPDGRELEVRDVALKVEMHEGTRRFRRIEAQLTASDGSTYEVVAEPLLRCWSMDGTGYDGGWEDGKALGFHRGEYARESDVYDLSHPQDVHRPDGSIRQPGHRETPVRVAVNGQPGTGHQVLLANGPIPALGLE